MNIAVMGAGGVGGYYGGLLARHGNTVWLIARRDHLHALQQRGLEIRSVMSGDFHVAIRATDDPRSVGPVDLILFTVKTYDTEVAAEAIKPLVGPQTVVLTMQNGIDNAERIGAIVGADRVMAGPVYIGARIKAPGVIEQNAGPCRIVFGEPTGGVSARGQRLLQSFQEAGIVCELSNHVITALWEKFMFICVFSGFTALARLPIGPIRTFPPLRQLYTACLQELYQVATASGVTLRTDMVDHVLTFTDAVTEGMKSSLQMDLDRGKRLEVDSLQGVVVRLGERLGIPTPVHTLLYAFLKVHDPHVDVADGGQATN
jgi:2-dehydropantoate 2-reductase